MVQGKEADVGLLRSFRERNRVKPARVRFPSFPLEVIMKTGLTIVDALEISQIGNGDLFRDAWVEEAFKFPKKHISVKDGKLIRPPEGLTVEDLVAKDLHMP